MSDLKLVPPEQPTPFEQRLLDAVANEAPSAEQRLRVRAALGLPVVEPVPVPVAPVGRRPLLLKAAGGLVVVSAAVVALFLAVGRKQNSADQPAPAPALVAQAPTAPLPAPSAAPSIAPPEAEPSGAVGPLLDDRDNGASNKRSRKAAAADSGADLSEQLRLIDAARSAVAAGNASAASAALTSYRKRFPRGPFGQEAAVLQIETLDLQGNHAQAAAQARSFLARHPNSPHVSVVQRIAGR